MRIAISTGGGDAPGLNAVIRAAVLSSIHRGWECVGITRGFGGLLGEGDLVSLGRDQVRGITHLGGTILGTSSRGNPLKWRAPRPDGTWDEHDRSGELIRAFRAERLDALIAIGGEGTLGIILELSRQGLPVIGVPKTIDNDVGGTSTTFGFDSAVATATDAIDKVHSTAESHDRVMVVEVMGRHAGFIALNAGVSGSADVILIPEIPFDIEKVCDKIRRREAEGRHFSIVVVAEGAVPKGGAPSLIDPAHERLGGIGDKVAHSIQEMTGKETRALVLGHLQRGGSPTTFDRLLGLRFGAAAIRLVAERQFGQMVALQPPRIVGVPLTEALVQPRRVPLDSDTITTARDLGVSFGD
ncbi:MAG: 6-phosphofructokinase [Gemmatimonadales bacterium]